MTIVIRPRKRRTWQCWRRWPGKCPAGPALGDRRVRLVWRRAGDPKANRPPRSSRPVVPTGARVTVAGGLRLAELGHAEQPQARNVSRFTGPVHRERQGKGMGPNPFVIWPGFRPNTPGYVSLIARTCPGRHVRPAARKWRSSARLTLPPSLPSGRPAKDRYKCRLSLRESSATLAERKATIRQVTIKFN